MIRNLLYRLALCSAMAFPLISLAQTGTIRGFVYDESTGEPSIFTPVSVIGTTQHGGQTDVNGYFSISKLPPGHYLIRVIYLGYDTLAKEVDVKADQIVSERLELKKSTTEMKTVTISAAKRDAQINVRVASPNSRPSRSSGCRPSAGRPIWRNTSKWCRVWSSPVIKADSSTYAEVHP